MLCSMKNKSCAGAIVLGMHDALVSLTGMIGGLTFALTERKLIILSAIIASVAAGLSMGASNYLAEKTNDNPFALQAGLTTGMSYLGTCAFLIAPFVLIKNTHVALVVSFGMAIIIIFGCNWCIRNMHKQPFWRHAIEMLIICTGVSIISFIIGELAKYTLGIII